MLAGSDITSVLESPLSLSLLRARLIAAAKTHVGLKQEQQYVNGELVLVVL